MARPETKFIALMGLLALFMAWKPPRGFAQEYESITDLYSEGWRSLLALRLEPAAKSLSRAVEAARAAKQAPLDGHTAWDLARPFAALAQLRVIQGRLAEAETLQNEALACLGTVSDPEQLPHHYRRFYWSARIELGIILFLRGRYSRAEAALHEAVGQAPSLHPILFDSEEEWSAQAHLADISAIRGRRGAAERIYGETVGHCGKYLDGDGSYRDPALLWRVCPIFLFHAGKWHQRAGRQDAAKSLYVRAFAALKADQVADDTERFVDQPHKEARRHDYLGRLYRAVPSADSGGSAERHLARALTLYERAYGPGNWLASEAMRHYALVLLDKGKAQDAETWLGAALKSRTAALGPLHPAVAQVLEDLARATRRAGRAREADEMEAAGARIRRGHSKQEGYNAQDWGP